jgi:hypothetical protein
MRHISRTGKAPDAAWLARAGELLEDMKNAATTAERHAIIDSHAAFWGEIKDWLLSLSYGKCWFSEAKDCFNHWHVEHFRPKKTARDADGTSCDGYWWLAFDWTNYRICGGVGNTKKGTFFPLRPTSNRIAPFGDTRLEDQLLLDPADVDDPGLLGFDVEGRARAAPGVTNPWELERVAYSVTRLKLDYGPLEAKRKTVWAECWTRIETYLDELTKYHSDQQNAYAKAGFKQAMLDIRSMVEPDQELSAVARACVLAFPDKRVAGVLQTT